jgi:WD40-like Beta Propeller Repeat
MNRVPRALTIALVGLCAANARPVATVTVERVYSLKPAEGVFAYARISPDGRYLAYASEEATTGRPNGRVQTVTVVDLQTGTVQFSEPGIDAYWSNDGSRMIYLSRRSRDLDVVIRHHETGEMSRNVAPAALGDYFSWSVRDGRDLILTILGNYYYLDRDVAQLPAAHVPECPGIGTGERPLISKDGRRISTFVNGMIVVRNLTDCANVLNTGLRGAKADFSWDGRFIAFHAPKRSSEGHDINIVDLEGMTLRRIETLPGSSYFPSWTKDGRLCFRYDAPDYRGFVIARDVLSLPETPLPQVPSPEGDRIIRWPDIFPDTPSPRAPLSLVLIWAPWNAHSPDALRALQSIVRSPPHLRDVSVATAAEPTSLPQDVDSMLRRYNIDLPRIPLATSRLALTGGLNQIPTTLLFRGGVLIERKLGAQSRDELVEWVSRALTHDSPSAR